MDLNAAVEKAVNERIEAKKDALIKQTLEEDHDYIMFKLHKIFGETYGHLDNYLKKTCLYQDEYKKILNILANMMDEVEETVTGKKKCNCDGTCTECTCNKEDVVEEEPDRIMLEEIPVDKQKRITISFDTLYEAKMWQEDVFKILKSKEDDNVFYIVDMNFNYDINKFEFIKNIEYFSKKAIRIGIGKLLDVKYGDIVGVDVYDHQLVIYNTSSNVNDLTEAEEPEEEVAEEIPTEPKKPFSLNDLLKEAIKRAAEENKRDKNIPWFIRHFRIEI